MYLHDGIFFWGIFKNTFLPLKSIYPNKHKAKYLPRGKYFRFISSWQLNYFCLFAYVILLFSIQEHDLGLSVLPDAGIIHLPQLMWKKMVVCKFTFKGRQFSCS